MLSAFKDDFIARWPFLGKTSNFYGLFSATSDGAPVILDGGFWKKFHSTKIPFLFPSSLPSSNHIDIILFFSKLQADA